GYEDMNTSSGNIDWEASTQVAHQRCQSMGFAGAQEVVESFSGCADGDFYNATLCPRYRHTFVIECTD
ncbi:MAG: hypothetical protein KJN90_03500, partial [Gammaproteobacteria bacterium]|nr:hypothetical protein [Gammaproteobacteria bacterium]